MSEKFKKIIIVAGFILSIIAIGVAIYFAFFAPTKTTPTPTVYEEGKTPVTGLLPSEEGRPTTSDSTTRGVLKEADEVAKGGITKVSTLTFSEVEAIKISKNGSDINYYDNSDGMFYSIKNDGTVTRLSNDTFPEVESISWNKDSNKAVLEFPDGSNVVYNFETGNQVTLPKHWEDFHFSIARDEIIAKSIGMDPRNRTLVVSNEDGSNVQAVQALGNNASKVTVSPSPKDNIIAFSDTGENQPGFGRKMLIPIGKKHENFKGLIVEGFGFTPVWSPRGDTLVYSVSGETSGYQPLLWIVNGSTSNLGDDRRNLGLNTWADKCVFFSEQTLYCAVPQNLPANSGLQRSFAEGYPDSLYKINVTTRQSSLIATTEDGIPMTNLRISTDESTLYFVNERTGLLQTMKLK